MTMMDHHRAYEETHPWLTFGLNIGEFTHNIWLMLGEAHSKCEHLAGVPLRPEDAAELWKVYLAKGAHATTSIEGNTFSEEQVRQRVEDPKPVPASLEYLANEVDNVIKALRGIDRAVMEHRRLPLDRARLCEMNAAVLAGIELEDGERPGCLRTKSVVVGGGVYRGAPAEDLEYLVDRLCEWLNEMRTQQTNQPDRAMAFAVIVVASILAHLYIAWIHPFIDGNGRTARLVEFQILAESGLVPLPAANILSDHYNRTRERYYRELRRTSAPGGSVVTFIEYAAQGLVDGLREQISYVRDKQMIVAWENYVHLRFQSEPDTPASKRRKRLVLDLPETWTHRDQIPDLTPKLAREYAVAGPRLLGRDLNAVKSLGLVAQFGRHYYRANSAVMKAFLPPVAQNGDEA